MLSKDKLSGLYIGVLSAFALWAMVWAIGGFPAARFDAELVALGLVAIFCSGYLPIRIPKLRAELSVSDGLLMLVLILYGGHIAVLMAVIVTAFGILVDQRQRGSFSPKTILASSSMTVIGTFLAAKLLSVLFVPFELIIARSDGTSLVWLFAAGAFALFAATSVLRSVLDSLESDNSGFMTHWSRSWLPAGVRFAAAVLAALAIFWSFKYINVLATAGAMLFFGVILAAFRRLLNNTQSDIDKATRASLARAEKAEKALIEREKYITALESGTEALQESHENFRHAAYHDSLTGLPNRNYFIDTLKVLLKETQYSSESNFAVLFLDLKSFKTINDSLGHSMGDRLIKNVAKRVSAMVRETDHVGRFSGDKFGIILTDLLSKDEATSFADRLARRVAEPYTLDDRQIFTSAKIGIAYGNSKYPEAEDILRDADIAMYYAKDNKENYVIFDQKMHIRAVTRLQLETDLRFAIERNEFELFYQPIVRLDTAALEGFEALVRWNHPQRGLVPPSEFIAISESTGLIIPMTVQILHAACAQIVKWQKKTPGERPLSIAVNLSGKHFSHPALVDQINTVVAETGIDPSSLKLELTESAVMENAETAILMLKQIKQIGVQISIDDFGTGYSSLSYLHRFPIDLLKVDRSFVSAMEELSENGEIVRTVIALAKALRLKVVAEGIESIHQFHQLRVLNCEYGQGYLFSKPLPAAEIERLLEDNNRWQSILPAAPNMVIPNTVEASHLRLAQ